MEDKYRRGQVEWALWRFAVLGLPADQEPDAAFRASIKNLLQIDRSQRAPGPRPITTLKAEGTGTDAGYLAFDAFCLGVAFDLQRFGFKQSDVLLLLSNLRSRLKPVFSEILESPPPFPAHLDRDGSWRADKPVRSEGPDRRIFLVLRRMELAESLPAFKLPRKKARASIFSWPHICRGLDELSTALDHMDHQFRRAFVLEIAQTAARMAEFLQEAPIIKRGRK